MSLWRTISQHKTELLAQFMRNLIESGELDDAEEAHDRDGIPALLDRLTLMLRSCEDDAHATLDPHARLIAAEHGEVRLEQGRTIEVLVREFMHLHQTILDFAHHKKVLVSASEHRALVRGINRAVVESVTRYARARDEELERTHAGHFAFLAHELRSPLANVRMGIDLLEDGTEQAAVIPRVRRAVDHIRELLDNQIVRIRLGSETPLHRALVGLGDLVRTVVDELAIAARDENIAVESKIAAGLELHADPRLLRSVVSNLVGNAIKFSHSGSKVEVVARSEGATIVLEVADACGGLPEGGTAAMFRAFEQSNPDRSGFGLGLAIVKQAVELHGGEVSVHDRPGSGCTMAVRLPRE
jgi:hypothetical protein